MAVAYFVRIRGIERVSTPSKITAAEPALTDDRRVNTMMLGRKLSDGPAGPAFVVEEQKAEDKKASTAAKEDARQT